jgi:hypothetical protein
LQLNNFSNNEQALEENSKIWFDVWKLIDNFDTKHVTNDYPYQQREIEMILNKTADSLNKTTIITKELELDFAQIENLLNDIIRKSESLYHNDDKQKNILFLKINILKDEIHRLYTKYHENALKEKQGQSELIKGVIQ